MEAWLEHVWKVKFIQMEASYNRALVVSRFFLIFFFFGEIWIYLVRFEKLFVGWNFLYWNMWVIGIHGNVKQILVISLFFLNFLNFFGEFKIIFLGA